MLESHQDFLNLSPYSLNHDEKRLQFTKKMNELTKYHYENSAEYKKMLDALNFSSEKDYEIEELPFLPVGLFKDYGLVVDTAESGKEAISKFEDGEYDVIFMDHMMPQMDGVEAMKCIREISTKTNKKVVILALTANVLSGAREMFIKEGFDGFLSKPINLSEFVRVMNSTLPEEMISREGGSDV